MEASLMSFEEIEDLFRKVAMTILGIPEKDNKTVRMPFGSSAETGSAPGFSREENVCFIYVIPADDGYGQQQHVSYEVPDDWDEEADGPVMLTRVEKYTDIYDIRFACYGPKGYDWARKIKTDLLKDKIRKLLRGSSFFLKVGIPPIVPTHESYEGSWWRRFDLTATFYAAVRTEQPGAVGTIENVTIKFEK
jgi:hypothetical protein